jgi:hypothetical protein
MPRKKTSLHRWRLSGKTVLFVLVLVQIKFSLFLLQFPLKLLEGPLNKKFAEWKSDISNMVCKEIPRH